MSHMCTQTLSRPAQTSQFSRDLCKLKYRERWVMHTTCRTYLNLAMRRFIIRTMAISRNGNMNNGATHDPYVQISSISPFSYILILTGSVHAEINVAVHTTAENRSIYGCEWSLYIREYESVKVYTRFSIRGNVCSITIPYTQPDRLHILQYRKTFSAVYAN